jgi:hypothetical protein
MDQSNFKVGGLKQTYKVTRVIGAHSKSPTLKELGEFTESSEVWAIEAARTRFGLPWTAKLLAEPVQKSAE